MNSSQAAFDRLIVSLQDPVEETIACLNAFQPDRLTSYSSYIQPKVLPAPAENLLRQGLRVLLPEAMVPTVFLFFDRLPRTVSGKVDRQALPAAPRRLVASRPPASLPQTPVELALAEIWKDLLGVDQVGTEDHFFDLGGDSLQASVLMARMEVRFMRKLPLSVLLQQDTLGGLARLIEGESGVVPQGLLVTIQPQGDKPPVFFIPGIGGETLVLRDLAANLGSERPLYGLQGAGAGGSARNLNWIEQAADEYEGAVRAAWPHGPFILVGYSFGGHLALETARRLAARSKTAPLVVLIDTYPPVPKRNTTLIKRVRIYFNNLGGLKGVREVAGYFRDRLQRIYLRLIRSRLVGPIAIQMSVPDRSPASAAQISLAAYRPAPYPGRVVLFKASQREWYVDWDPMDAWKEFISGELEIHTLPGEHDNLVKNPYVIELARQLHEVLKDFST
jgi:thioesterase domain-containing protein/acyl carrier protein